MSKYTMTSTKHGTAVTTIIVVLVLVALVLLVGYTVYIWQEHRINALNAEISSLNAQLLAAKGPSREMGSPASTFTSPKGVQAILYVPSTSDKVSSPMAILGKIPGNWSSEASFPVVLRDSKGRTIAQGSAHVLGNWMTTQPVPFSAQLTFTGMPSGNGSLVLQRDNPSGLPTNNDSITVPVRF